MGTGSAPVVFQEQVYPALPLNADHNFLIARAASFKKSRRAIRLGSRSAQRRLPQASTERLV
jgi:hypothetical protein